MISFLNGMFPSAAESAWNKITTENRMAGQLTSPPNEAELYKATINKMGADKGIQILSRELNWSTALTKFAKEFFKDKTDTNQTVEALIKTLSEKTTKVPNPQIKLAQINAIALALGKK